MASVTDPLFLVVAGSLAWTVRRLARRGSLSRMWFRLWLYTLRERLRQARRQWHQFTMPAVLPARPAPTDARPRGPAPRAGAAPAACAARDGVWVGNVFRPHAFRRMRGSR